MKSAKASLLLAGVVSSLSLIGFCAHAQQKEVEIGLIDAQTGPWAAPGANVIKGAEMAVEEINAGGGIKALGGAKLKLVIADSGARPDDSSTAAQRILASNPGIVAGLGPFISSQALAVTEITERLGIPWFVQGSADQLTSRGFKSVFATNMAAGQVAPVIVPIMEKLSQVVTGHDLKDVAIIAVNTPGTIGVADGVESLLKAKGINIVAKETFAVQLTEGTVIGQRIRRSRPSFILFSNAIATDAKTVLTGLAQVGITSQNTPILVYGSGPFENDALNLMSKDALEGLMGFVNVWPTKGSEAVEGRWKAKTGQSWMTFDPSYAYGHIYVIKEALEKAGSADRTKVAETLRSIKIESGPATLALAGPVAYDSNGRRNNAPAILIQWQNGVPLAVYPPALARAQPSKGLQ